MTQEPKLEYSQDARDAFFEYMIGVGHGEATDFDELCLRRPEIARELRALRDLVGEIESATAETMVDRIWRRYGPDVDPNISLDRIDEDAARAKREAAGEKVDETLAKLPIKGGRYRLQSEVDRGGQGAVLRVWDEDLRRNLAMKIVLLRPDSRSGESTIDPQALRRFLEEAQVTGQLDHPGIVPVHDLGLDEEGRVYFTMKLVRGENLRVIFRKVKKGADGWSRTRALGVISRVCEAMSYAHHKGVIHRDLKPANIMVGRFGEVFVMDWGLARVAGREEVSSGSSTRVRTANLPSGGSGGVESSLETMHGDVIGTPSYMSPEQALGDLDHVGPHSDVYAVGAMLYELLAGRMPYEQPGEPLNNIAIWQAVCDGPPYPLASVAQDVPPELEAICERAMARAPADRYEDMQALGADLQAYLENRVVRAHATGAWPELQKWVQRNRSLAAACAAAFVLLVAGLAISLVLRQRAVQAETLARAEEARANDAAEEARRAAQRAVEAEQLARTEERRANDAAQEARRAAETAGQVSDFMVGLFRVSDPSEARGSTITAREILDRGEARIRDELGDQPEVRTNLMVTMGSVYRGLGLYARSADLLEESLADRRAILGDEHPEVARTLQELGELYRLRTDFARAEPYLREALALRRRLPNRSSLEVAETALELAELLREAARHDEADPLFREALDLRRAELGQGPEVAEVLNGLAFNLRVGDPAGAEAMMRESLDMLRGALGEHPLVASALNDLAVLLYDVRKVEEVKELYRESLEMKRRLFGDVHPEVAIGLNNLANVVHDEGDPAAAAAMYREALEVQLQLVGEAHTDVGQVRNNLAFALLDQGDLAGAREQFQASLDAYRSVHGEGHPEVRAALENSVEFLRIWRADRERTLGSEHPEYAAACLELAEVLLDAGSNAQAEVRAAEALERFGEAGEPARMFAAQGVLGSALGAQGQYEEAEGLLLEAYEALDAELGPAAAPSLRVRARLADLYERWGLPEEAAGWRAPAR